MRFRDSSLHRVASGLHPVGGYPHPLASSSNPKVSSSCLRVNSLRRLPTSSLLCSKASSFFLRPRRDRHGASPSRLSARFRLVARLQVMAHRPELCFKPEQPCPRRPMMVLRLPIAPLEMELAHLPRLVGLTTYRMFVLDQDPLRGWQGRAFKALQ